MKEMQIKSQGTSNGKPSSKRKGDNTAEYHYLLGIVLGELHT